MVRRSAGFVTKKPHRKSRGGCLVCKRKKVKSKCDETQPACGYCTLRKLNCEYPFEAAVGSSNSSPNSSRSESPSIRYTSTENELDSKLQVTPWLVPVAHTASGQLTFEDLELLHHYKTITWQKFALQEDPTIIQIHRDVVPNLSISADYLLYALLSIAAVHENTLQPSAEKEHKALLYRQKTFQVYTKALQNITSDNYESVLVTGTFLLALMPAPNRNATDEEHLDWMHSLLKLTEGLRVLASLRWAHGIEKLTVFPLFRRELRTLPPPPIIDAQDRSHLQGTPGPLGTTPDHPNPPPTYGIPFALSFANEIFLPPPLSKLLENMVRPQDPDTIDFHRGALVPAFYALSPIFLSLYYYHLNPDFYVRTYVFCSFLMPDFLALVKAHEPRALAVVAWWFALAGLVPRGWWVGESVTTVVEAAAHVVRKIEDAQYTKAMEGAERIVHLYESHGRTEAAKSVFDDWEGVTWADGPTKAEEWERSLLVDLNLDLELVEDLGS